MKIGGGDIPNEGRRMNTVGLFFFATPGISHTVDDDI
jgi:hypothetical protein